MREQRSGTIINITSMGGKIYTPLGAWYHATKFALEALDRQFLDCGVEAFVLLHFRMPDGITAAEPRAPGSPSTHISRG